MTIIESELSGLKELAPTLDLSFYMGGSMIRQALSNAMLGLEHSLHKMMVFVSRMIWFRAFEDAMHIGYRSSTDDYYNIMLEDDSVQKEFQNLLDNAGVAGKIMVREGSDGKKILYNKIGKTIKESVPFFPTASSGTKALYTLFYWYKTAPDISLMCVDEFDAYYHFELSETIVDLLSKLPNTQVLLTSHNTNLLTNNLIRPDCLFVLTPEKLTSFTNATKRELREGHNLERLYMGGEFNG